MKNEPQTSLRITSAGGPYILLGESEASLWRGNVQSTDYANACDVTGYVSSLEFTNFRQKPIVFGDDPSPLIQISHTGNGDPLTLLAVNAAKDWSAIEEAVPQLRSKFRLVEVSDVLIAEVRLLVQEARFPGDWDCPRLRAEMSEGPYRVETSVYKNEDFWLTIFNFMRT